MAAWHASHPDEGQVLLQISVGEPHGLERLRRTAKVLAGFSHPGAARLIHQVLDDDPPHLVLSAPRAPGLRGPLPAVQALDAVTGVAAALSAAHGSAIWGPDLRSGTVLGPPGTPVVTDWGTAWRAGMNPGEEPEGSVARDIGALGRLLYSLLTGLPPGSKDLDPGEAFSDPLRALVKKLTGPAADRPGTAREVAYALKELRSAPSTGAGRAPERFMERHAMLRRPQARPRVTVGHASGVAVVVLLACVTVGAVFGTAALLWLLSG